MIKLTVALPVWNSKIAWLAMESLCNQETDFDWELLIAEDNSPNFLGKSFFESYLTRLENVHCKRLNFIYLNSGRITLGDKWRILAENSSNTSIGICPIACDDFQQNTHLKSVYEALIQGYTYILNRYGIMYNLLSGKTLLFDHYKGRKDNASIWVGIIPDFLKRLPKCNKWAGIDGWIKAQVRQYEEFKEVILEKPFNHINIYTDGANQISKHRAKFYDNTKPPFIKMDIDVSDTIPKAIFDKIKAMIIEDNIPITGATIATAIKKSNKTDIVIPYLKTSNSNIQLAINSIKKNANFDHRIIVIGDNPDLPEVFHIPHTRAKNITNPKLRDSYDKLQIIINNPNISQNFILTYDDIYWNKPVKLDFFNRIIALNSPGIPNNTQNSGWSSHLYRTLRYLNENGHSYLNFETHLPRFFNKNKLSQILTLPFTNKNMLIASLYFNIFHDSLKVEFLTKNKQIKAGFYGSNSPYSYKDMGDLNQICDSNIFINHNQAGLNDNLRKYLTKFLDE